MPFIIAIIVIALILVISNIYVVQQSRAYVIERLGAFHCVQGVGLHFKVPFLDRIARKVSLKATTHDNPKQKINDEMGNPIEVGIIVIWRVLDTAKAVFNVDNYKMFLSTQAATAFNDEPIRIHTHFPPSAHPSRS